MKISKVELKAIKTFEGMDGYGLNANVYINGKREAFALDEGCGGEMLLRWEHDLHGESREVEEAFGAWCEAHRHWIDFVESMRKGSPDKGIPADPAYDGEYAHPEDVVIGAMVEDWESRKWVKSKSRKNVLFRTPDTGEGDYRQVTHRGDVVGAIRWILKEYPDARIYGQKHHKAGDAPCVAGSASVPCQCEFATV